MTFYYLEQVSANCSPQAKWGSLPVFCFLFFLLRSDVWFTKKLNRNYREFPYILSTLTTVPIAINIFPLVYVLKFVNQY